jgi:transitional endoplasmic reticulum ATPase
MELCLSPAAAPECIQILTPVQQYAADGLRRAIARGNVVVLEGDAGQGKTTVLGKIHEETGGAFLGMRDFIRALDARHPFAIEEAWMRLAEDALETHDFVFMDDLHLIAAVATGCSYPRANLLDAAVTALVENAGRYKKLIVSVEDEGPQPIHRRAQRVRIAQFAAEDYETISRSYLGERAARVDYARVHRFAPALNAHQLTTACGCMLNARDLTTDSFIDYLGSQNLTSNVEIEQVTAVDWKDLKGVEDIIHALEVKIALPFEQHDLAARFQLKPKRGVLLAGPPGTGKTTIGKALAHRLKSKFFLIDGTMIAGSRDFYWQVMKVFDAAKRNAPSILFIDDADVIFESQNKEGLYRYLLTMLDGLEGASAERVCVMMTAMNVSSLPRALVRSGRIELWLETRLPDEQARTIILDERIASLPEPLNLADSKKLARATDQFTGADLTSAVEDAKLLYAHDWSRDRTRQIDEYYLEAIEAIRTNRRNYTRAKPAPGLDAKAVGFGALAN